MSSARNSDPKPEAAAETDDQATLRQIAEINQRRKIAILREEATKQEHAEAKAALKSIDAERERFFEDEMDARPLFAPRIGAGEGPPDSVTFTVDHANRLREVLPKP